MFPSCGPAQCAAVKETELLREAEDRLMEIERECADGCVGLNALHVHECAHSPSVTHGLLFTYLQLRNAQKASTNRLLIPLYYYCAEFAFREINCSANVKVCARSWSS